MKLLLKERGGSQILYITPKRELIKISPEKEDAEKIIIKDCLFFDGCSCKENNGHIIAFSDKNGLFYITISGDNIKMFKLSPLFENIVPNSLKIISKDRICFVILCRKYNENYIYHSFFLEKTVSMPQKIITSKKPLLPLYFSKNEDGDIDLVLKQNKKILYFKFIWSQKVWLSPITLYTSEQEISNESFLIRNNHIYAVFKTKDTLFFISGKKDDNFIKNSPTPLTKSFPENGYAVLEKSSAAIKITWQDKGYIITASKFFEETFWRKLEKIKIQDTFDLYKTCIGENSEFSYKPEKLLKNESKKEILPLPDKEKDFENSLLNLISRQNEILDEISKTLKNFNNKSASF